MSRGGNIVDSHSIDYFPERWFDLVLVLRTNNTVLFDRLTKRGYSQKKVTENIVRLRMLLFFLCWWLVFGLELVKRSKREDLFVSMFRSVAVVECVVLFFFFFFSPLLTMNLFLVFSFPFPFPFRLLFLFFFSSPSSIYLGM